jgi:beta-glucanase (GH16 family)
VLRAHLPKLGAAAGVVLATIGGFALSRGGGGDGGTDTTAPTESSVDPTTSSTTTGAKRSADALARPSTTATSAPPSTAPAPPTTEPPPPTSAAPGLAPTGNGPSAGAERGWPLVAEYGFDGPAVDTSTWLVYDSVGNGGVGLRRPSAVSQGDGELRITGRGDVSGGMSLQDDRTYGRWEIRARADRGNGYAPAILLWPASNDWPIEGEIDIAEIPRGDRSETHFTVHWGADNQQVGFTTPGDFTQWHTFGVEWMPDHITYFLDGQPLHTIADPPAIPSSPMNLAIQNDVGPFNWIPARDATTPAEVSLRVDWVRVYDP